MLFLVERTWVFFFGGHERGTESFTFNDNVAFDASLINFQEERGAGWSGRNNNLTSSKQPEARNCIAQLGLATQNRSIKRGAMDGSDELSVLATTFVAD